MAEVERAGFRYDVRDREPAAAMRKLAKEWQASAPDVFVLDSVDQDKIPESAALLGNEKVYSVVVIDDPADRDVACDLLINALPSIPSRCGKSDGLSAFRISGTEHLILPDDFAAERARAQRSVNRDCARGFAFFGGADLEDFTRDFIDAAANSRSSIEWTLLLGPSYVHADEVLQKVSGNRLIRVQRHLPSMARVFSDSDIAVIAAGNTLAECAAAGTPLIALSQNEVQLANANFFEEACAVINLGRKRAGLADELRQSVEALAADPDRRAKMSKCLSARVDGLGAERIAKIIADGAASR
jgi:spore coat polysaccharide biosynthesis predicted glycosyltransferase SpsG